MHLTSPLLNLTRRLRANRILRKIPPRDFNRKRLLKDLYPNIPKNRTAVRTRVQARVPLHERKQIFLSVYVAQLPNFTVTLLRPPKAAGATPLSPYWAHFHVPLWFSKLDMRDFLLRAYQVRTTQIRSSVMYTKISRQGNRRAIIPKPHRWFRHRSTKKMAVQMTEGFVWPEEIPESQLDESFSKKTYHEGEKEGRLEQVGRQPDSVMRPKVREMRMLEEQAKDLLRRREPWRPSWVDYGYGVKPLGAQGSVGRS